MKRILKMLQAAALVAALLSPCGGLKAETIERLELAGNHAISRDTILFYMKSQEKGVFSTAILKQDFQTLWNTGFFENITISETPGKEGKIITLTVVENPMISAIRFDTVKKFSEKSIREMLTGKSISLESASFYNPVKLSKVSQAILEMMKEKGYHQGTAVVEMGKKAGNKLDVLVRVRPGPRSNIGAIDFPGLDRRNVSPGFLIAGMKNNKPHSLLASLGGKDIYQKDKMAEDLEEIRNRLRRKGYLEARVKTPEISHMNQLPLMGHVRKMMKISIPVEMGPCYRVSAIRIEGNNVVKAEHLRSLIKLEQGDVFDGEKVNAAVRDIVELYQTLGRIYCYVSPREDLDPANHTALLTLTVNEGVTAYLRNLNFKGNQATRDAVIRREWLLAEGYRMNMSSLTNGLLRIRQLGLVQVEQAPEIKPDGQEPEKIDVTIPVKETNRQAISFNFGYSGLDKLFVALGYSTQNLFGRGASLAMNLQQGTNGKQYSFSYVEPYLFNLPVNGGINLNYTDNRFFSLYSRKTRGFGFSSSGRLFGYFGASLSYNYSDIETYNVAASLPDETKNRYMYSGVVSSLSPALYYSTIDAPLFPTSGTKIFLNYRYSGGALGGDFNLHKTKFQFLRVQPLWKSHSLAFQLVYEGISTFGGTSSIPVFEELWLNGDQSVRGFQYLRAVNAQQSYVAGNKAFHVNVQYQIPVSRDTSLYLFYDAGNVYAKGQPLNLRDSYSSMGLEAQILVPMLNVPFRLIFAYNPRVFEPGESKFQFRFSVGAMW